MPIVRLPDGTRLNFPAGMSEDEMAAAIDANFPNEQALPKDLPDDVRKFQEAKVAKEQADASSRTWGEFAGDTARSLTQGSIDATAGLGGFLYGFATGNYDNSSSEFARGMNEILEEGKSKKAQLERKAVQKAVDAADGGWEKAAVGGWETLTNPTMLTDQVARSLPAMAAGGVLGRGATAATNATGNALLRVAPDRASKVASAGLAVGKTAPVVGGAVAEGTAALAQGSSVANDTYEAAMKVPIEVYAQQEGFKDLAEEVGAEEAKRLMASDATTRAGLMGTLASAASMRAVPGGNAIERMFIPKALSEAGDAVGTSMLTKPLTKGFAGGMASKAGELAVKGTAVGAAESVSEGLEEGSGAVAKALELSPITGGTPDLGSIFAEAAGQAAPVGFLIGKVAGMRSQTQEDPAPAPKVEDMPTTPQAPAPAPAPKAPKATSAQSILERESEIDGVPPNVSQADQAVQASPQQQEAGNQKVIGREPQAAIPGEAGGSGLQAPGVSTQTQIQADTSQPSIESQVTQPAQPAANAGGGAGASQPTQVAPRSMNVVDLDPGQLLRVSQNQAHPMADAARQELKRREVEYLYQQREAQQQAQREADARPLMDEAADQQVAQADAVVNAASLEAPTAMAQAFAQAKAMKPKVTGLAAEMESIRTRASNAPPPLASAGSLATKNVADSGQQEMADEFERLYQQDVKAAIQERLGLAPKSTATQADAKPIASPFRSFLREVGISSSLAADITGARGLKANNALPATFRKNGRNLDDLASLAVERGFLSQSDIDSAGDNGGTNKLVQMIQAEIRGERQQSVATASESAEQAHERVQRLEIEGVADSLGLQYSPDTSTDALATMVSRVQRRIEQANAPQGTTKAYRVQKMAIAAAQRIEQRRAAEAQRDSEYASLHIAEQNAYIDVIFDDDGTPIIVDKRAIDAELAAQQMAGKWSYQNERQTAATADQGTGQNPRETGPPVAGIQDKGAGDASQERGQAQRDGEAGTEEGLSSYTPAEVVARQDAQALAQRQDAAQQAAVEQRAQADAQRDEFTLTGSDRAADANPAQEGLFANEPTSSYNAPYEKDLFGEPIPQPAGRAKRVKTTSQGVRGNLQPDTALPDTQAPAGEYLINTAVSSEHPRTIGASVVNSAKSAAQATSYLYKSAVERFDGIVTDANGKVLAVVGGFKGALTQSSVYPGTIAAEAVRIPGAANIWFSHNHPSGNATLSSADHNLYKTLANVFRGSGIEPRGLLAVSGNRFSSIGPDNASDVGEIKESQSTATVPVYERTLVPATQYGELVSSPAEAKTVAARYYAKKSEPGILLLNSQLAVAAWVPIDNAMRGTLRNGELGRIYRAASQSNAGNAIIVHGGELDTPGNLPADVTASQNIAAALQLIDVRAVDSVNVKTGRSVADGGGIVAKGLVYSRKAKAPAAPRNLDADITLEIPVEGGKTARMTVNAQTYINQLDKREEALRMVKECMG